MKHLGRLAFKRWKATQRYLKMASRKNDTPSKRHEWADAHAHMARLGIELDQMCREMNE